MRTVDIPGGTATFLETSGENRDEIPGRSVKLLKAASMAAATQLSDYPELFEPPRTVAEGEEEREESAEERKDRLDSRLAGIKLTTEQAMAFDNMREATVVATLKSWTLDRRLPTLETIGDLDGELYVALLDAVGGVSSAELEERFDAQGGPPNLASGQEAKDPTGDSGSSSNGSTATPESDQTTTSSTDGSLTAGEASTQEQ